MKRSEYEKMLKYINEILEKSDDEISIKEKLEAIKLKKELELIPDYLIDSDKMK